MYIDIFMYACMYICACASYIRVYLCIICMHVLMQHVYVRYVNVCIQRYGGKYMWRSAGGVNGLPR